MKRQDFPRIDADPELYGRLLPLCRLRPGEVWTDPVSGHRVGVADAAVREQVMSVVEPGSAVLSIHDPPYGVDARELKTEALKGRSGDPYMEFSKRWAENAVACMAPDAGLYIWLGADQNNGFAPLPEFMIMMRGIEDLRSRSFITVRNQRGYGTQGNWMAVRQELLYYVRGNPPFHVRYTEIPKVLKGYYKTVGGRLTENLERGRSPNIRPGNVWLDIQQVFYRMEENVPGAYAQKPLSALRRIIEASSREGDLVADFFSHAGTTLIASELTGRRCATFDIDPVFAELTIRRLEHLRRTGKTGWQTESPFPEVALGLGTD